MNDAEIREAVGSYVAGNLRQHTNVLKVYGPDDKVGPMGGKQRTMTVAYDDGDEIHGMIVVVYSDENCMDKLLMEVEKHERSDELRKRLVD